MTAVTDEAYVTNDISLLPTKADEVAATPGASMVDIPGSSSPAFLQEIQPLTGRYSFPAENPAGSVQWTLNK